MLTIVEIDATKQLTMSEDLSVQEAEQITIANSIINSISFEQEFYKELDEAYEDYLGLSKESKISFTKMKRTINNFLSSYKGFIDGWETNIKRNKEEQHLKFFKSELASIYDDNFEYRLAYNLRNYAQHVGNPISSFSHSIEAIEVILDKSVFLQNHPKMQSSFKKELEQSDVKMLNIDQAIKVVHKVLMELHVKMFNYIINSTDSDDLLRASVAINRFYIEHSKNNGDLYLTDTEDLRSKLGVIEKENVKLNLKYVDRRVARLIMKSATMKFKFKGRYVGKSSGLPILFKANLAVEVPRFKIGQQRVKYKEIYWTRVTEITGWRQIDKYDKYFAVYAPSGLAMSDYKDIIKEYKEEADSFF
ncbi:MAG: hypothetical protein ACFWTY_09705 [Shouchella clausii]|jgi:hypothetical protein